MSKRIITAIDIGSTKITAVIATFDEGRAPQVIGVATQPSQGLKKGVIVNIDNAINSIASTLEAAERMAGLTVSSVYVTINGKHITSTNNKGVVAVSTEEINKEDVYRAIESARTVSIPPTREILHVIPREFIVDAQGGIKDPIGMSGTRLEVDAHIVSATSTALQNLMKCIQSLGLRVDDILFTGWSSANAVLTDTEKELGVIMLDIGGGTTSISSFVEDALTFSASIPLGGTNITSDLAIGLRVSLEDAEKIKLALPELMKRAKENPKTESRIEKLLAPKGSMPKEETKEESDDMIDISVLNIPEVRKVSKGDIEKIVEARLDEIFELVMQELDHNGFSSRLPAGVVITGGAALTAGITTFAKKKFGAPSRVAYPKGLSGLTDEISSPAFSAVQGLVTYGTSDTGNVPKSNVLSSDKTSSEGNFLDNLKGLFKKFAP